jgi:TonB family protein
MFARRIRFVWLAALPILLPTEAMALEPLKPAKPWVVDFDTTECHAERQFSDPAGPVTLAIRPSPDGDTYELLVARNRPGPRYGEEFQGTVDFGQGPIKAWLLNYGVKTPILNILKFRISKAQMMQAQSASIVRFHVNGTISGPSDVSFTLRAMPDLLAGLSHCTDLLQHYWNMIPPERGVIATPASGDIRHLWSSDDYPAEAASNGQEGDVQFLLLIDEKGSVAACQVLQASGVPVLDSMGCQVLRERAKMKPALNSDGKPVRSAIVTPSVRWRIR